MLCDCDFCQTFSVLFFIHLYFTVECDKGQGVSNGDTTSCRPCAVGQYNNKTGENPNICKLCPRGLTTTNPGQSICNVSSKYTLENIIAA